MTSLRWEKLLPWLRLSEAKLCFQQDSLLRALDRQEKFIPQPVWTLFWNATQCFGRTLWPLMLKALIPALMIKLGVWLALIMPVLWVIDGLAVVVHDIPILIIAALVALLPGVLVLSYGIWQYILVMGMMNRYVVQGILGQPFEPHEAESSLNSHGQWYARVWMWMLAVWVPSMVLGAIGYVGLAQWPALWFLWFALGLGVAGVFSLAAMVFSLFLVFAPQVASFIPEGGLSAEGKPQKRLSALECVSVSVILVAGQCWQTLAMLVMFFLLTACIIPFILVFTLDLLGLTSLLSGGVLWTVSKIMAHMPMGGGSDPIGMVFSYIQSQQGAMSLEITRSLISTLITETLLPWGTAGFFLLFWEALQRRGWMVPEHLEDSTQADPSENLPEHS